MNIDAETIRRGLACGQPRCVCGKPNSLVHCPAHDDEHPSLSVSEEDGMVLIKCHAGCPQDSVIEALRVRNLWPSKNGDRQESGKGKITRTYDYQTAQGKMIYQVCRMEPKDFRQRRPDGAGGWIWKMAGVKMVPFQLPKFPGAETIYVPEGEKDCESLAKLGMVGTTNAGGGNAKWRSEYNPHFKGKHVVILPDNDEPGRDHGLDVAKNLYGVALSVKIVALPGLPEKGDVSDWILAGGTREQLFTLTGETPEWEPAEETLDVKIISADTFLATELERPSAIIGSGIFMGGSGLILTGESGIGKSLFSIELAVKLSKGLSFWDYGVDKPYRVLFIQKENPDYSVQTRLRRICKGLEARSITNIFMVERSFEADIGKVDDLGKIQRIIKKTKAEIVILDPLSSYHSANENNNIAMRQVLNGLTEISIATGCSWVVLHHEGKPSDGKLDKWRFRGASSIRDWADTMIGLTHKPNSEGKVWRQLNFDKMRHGRELSSLLLERDENFCHRIVPENTLVPLSLIADFMDELGGKCRGKTPLIKKIVQFIGCEQSTASRAVDMAMGKVISEVNGELILLTKF